jgi:hypothetical protein
MIGDLLTGAGAQVSAEVTDALGAAVPTALTLLAAVIGWKLFRRFIKA